MEVDPNAVCFFECMSGALIWVARRLGAAHEIPADAQRGPVILLLVLVYLQIVVGAFVAGLDAGQGYNTWPLIDGSLVPAGLDAMDPWWKNLFENALNGGQAGLHLPAVEIGPVVGESDADASHVEAPARS